MRTSSRLSMIACQTLSSGYKTFFSVAEIRCAALLFRDIFPCSKTFSTGLCCCMVAFKKLFWSLIQVYVLCVQGLGWVLARVQVWVCCCWSVCARAGAATRQKITRSKLSAAGGAASGIRVPLPVFDFFSSFPLSEHAGSMDTTSRRASGRKLAGTERPRPRRKLDQARLRCRQAESHGRVSRRPSLQDARCRASKGETIGRVCRTPTSRSLWSHDGNIQPKLFPFARGLHRHF